MKIAYSCHDALPSSSTNTQQVFWTVVEVARLGVQIQLYVPAVRARQAEEAIDAVSAYYGGPHAVVPASLTIVACGKDAEDAPRNWVEAARFDWNVQRRFAGTGIDCVWTRDPLALASSLRAGWPSVFETYRPDYATRLGFAPWRRACLRHRGLRGVILHSALAANAFAGAGVPADRCLVAHNGFAPDLLEPRRTRDEARRLIGMADARPLVVYTGHAGREKGTDVLARIAARVPAADFVIVGVEPTSDEGRRLAEHARREGAENLHLRPRVAPAEVAKYLYAADCLIVPPTDEPLRRFRRTVLPMKLFTYLAAGRPILAGAQPDVEEILTSDVTAVLVPPNDVDAAAAALRRLLGDSDLRGRLAAASLEASRAFTWSARARRLVDFFERQVRGGFSSNAAAASSRR